MIGWEYVQRNRTRSASKVEELFELAAAYSKAKEKKRTANNPLYKSHPKQ